MAYIPTITIDGVSVPLPDNYSQTISDLSSEESGTNLDGTSDKDVIGTQASIPFKYEKLEWVVGSTVANAINGKSELTVSYPDIRNPYANVEHRCYVGNRKTAIVQNDSDGKVYWSLEFDVITKDGRG